MRCEVLVVSMISWFVLTCLRRWVPACSTATCRRRRGSPPRRRPRRLTPRSVAASWAAGACGVGPSSSAAAGPPTTGCLVGTGPLSARRCRLSAFFLPTCVTLFTSLENLIVHKSNDSRPYEPTIITGNVADLLGVFAKERPPRAEPVGVGVALSKRTVQVRSSRSF